MSDPATVENVQTSTEQDGKVLTGLGQPSDALIEHMDRRAEPAKEPTASGAATGEGAPPPGTAAAPSEPLTRGRQRFSDLTKERDAARAETTAERTKRETLEREVTELRARVQQAATPQQAQQAQQQLTQAEHRQTAQPVNGQRFQFPSYDDAITQYPNLTYDEWSDAKLEAHANWREAQLAGTIEQRIQAGIHADRQQRTVHDQMTAIHGKGRAVYKDYDAMLTSGPGAGVLLGPTREDAAQRHLYILQHPRSEHLQYAILRDGDLARRLQQANAFEFASILAEIAPAQASVHAANTQPPPAPYSPVGTGSSTTVTPSSELASRGFDFDKSGYREKRAAERGLRRAR